MSDTNTVKVLVVVKYMGPGGSETYLVNVLSAVDRQKYRVTIVCTADRQNWYKDELDRLGIKTLVCPNPYSQIGYICRIHRIIKAYCPDVVCDFRADLSAPTLFAAKLAGVKKRIVMYRSTRWGFAPSPLRNLYANIMQQVTKHLATRIIGNSPQVLDAFFPCWRKNVKYVVVRNGIDLKKFSPGLSGGEFRRNFNVPRERVVIGHVGSFRLAKNHTAILESFAGLRARYDNIHLLLVGDGAMRGDVEHLIAKLRIADCVTLAGAQKDIPKALAAMDIFFYPSIYEGMPNALIEAMACGLPVVASNIGEIVEVVPKSFEGQLFAADNIEGFADALERLCLDKTLRKELGCVARRHVEENFSLSASAEKLCRYL
jgi:glycosyltransferase involved in cell wall biosynthesis